jgi:hypothetical protein
VRSLKQLSSAAPWRFRFHLYILCSWVWIYGYKPAFGGRCRCPVEAIRTSHSFVECSPAPRCRGHPSGLFAPNYSSESRNAVLHLGLTHNLPRSAIASSSVITTCLLQAVPVSYSQEYFDFRMTKFGPSYASYNRAFDPAYEVALLSAPVNLEKQALAATEV